MSIITFQNQDCKVYKQVPMTKDLLVKDLFSNITKSTLRGQSYNNILDTLKRGLRYNDCKTKYSQNKVVVKDACPNNSFGSYNRSVSHLKKLGMILSHEGHIYLNPLVETRTTSKFYELVIEYYNLLWSNEFKSSVYINYKGHSYTLPTVEGLKQIIVDEYKCLIQFDEGLEHLTTQNLHDIAFKFKKAELEEQFPSVNSRELVALKSKLTKIYTNLGSTTMKEIAATHADILFEQLPIQRLDNNEVAFARLPKTWKCIHFTETSIYQEALELYSVNHSVNQLIYFTQEKPFTVIQQPQEQDMPTKTITKEYRALEASLAAKQSPEHIEELRQHNELMYKEYLDGEKRYGKPVFDWESNIPIQEPFPLTEEQKDTVALIRKKGRFPTNNDNLPIDIHVELCTEAHNKWAANNKLLPDKNKLASSMFSSISIR